MHPLFVLFTMHPDKYVLQSPVVVTDVGAVAQVLSTHLLLVVH